MTAAAAHLVELGVRSIAVCFLHSYREPDARAARRGDHPRAAPRTSRCRCRRASCASTASTSARPPRCSTPTSGRSSSATSTDLERELADRGFAGALPDHAQRRRGDDRRRGPPVADQHGAVGAGRRHHRRLPPRARLLGRERRGARRHRRHVARRLRDRAAARPTERVRGRARALPAADPDLRHPHHRRRRRLDRLARRRPAEGRPAQRRRGARARSATAGAAPSRPSPTPAWCSATSTRRASSAGDAPGRRRRAGRR